MKRLLFILPMFFAAITACTPQNRIVENPFIAITNTKKLDISKVELRDTVTVVDFSYRGLQGSRFKIVKDSYLQVGDEKFVTTAVEGIKFDKWNKADDEGKATFTMYFPTLPPKTKSFDFVEGDGKDPWVLRNVDLTGRAKRPKYHPELPKEYRKEIYDEELPSPSRKSGMTTVTVHFMGWDSKLFTDTELRVHHPFGREDSYSMPIDEATKSATFKYMQYGTSVANIQMGEMGYCRAWIEPCEDNQIWIDMNFTGEVLMFCRSGQPFYDIYPDYHKLYSNGVHSNINRVVGSSMFYNHMCMRDLKFDYSMTADECCDLIVERYKHYADSLPTISEMHPLHKKTASIWFDLSLLECVNDINNVRIDDYWRKNRDDEECKNFVPLKFTPEQYKKMLAPIDFNDDKLMINDNVAHYLDRGAEMLETVGVPKNNVYREAAMAYTELRKAYSVEYTDEEIAQLKRDYSPLFYETVKSIYEEEKLKLEIAKGKTEIKVAPKVANDQLFEAILEQYKGKVVFVDFWNVGCTGCHWDFQWIEPLKTGDLSTDNVVWLYIASDASPLNSYIIDIANIKGVHYRLAHKQWNAIGKKYGFNYMPCYFIVDKAGNIKMVDDKNRSASGFKKVINEALKK